VIGIRGWNPQASKFGNQKTEIDGIVFASRHEATRYVELRYMERAGLIWGLKTQVPYELIPAQRDESGKVVERAVTYIADFVYWTDSRTCVVEDAKGYRTDVYKLKKKLMLYVHGIRIQEV
jgi:hypothetical protein